MAKRQTNLYEYVDEVSKDGKGVTHTLRVKLYAPDGHIFNMPHGGDPAVYTSRRGYKTQPDAEWYAKNKEYEAAQAKSLKLSNFQREHKERQVLLAQDAETLRLEQSMEAQERAMADAEAEQKAKRAAFDQKPNAILDDEGDEKLLEELFGESAEDPEPAPTPAPPKPKAKAKAKAKRKPTPKRK